MMLEISSSLGREAVNYGIVHIFRNNYVGSLGSALVTIIRTFSRILAVVDQRHSVQEAQSKLAHKGQEG